MMGVNAVPLTPPRLEMVKQPPAAYSPELLGQLTSQFRADKFHVRNLAVEVAVVAALRPTVTTTPSNR